MVKPIFVVGKNRSGTKWLSNIIAQHPNVACVQGEDFSGILETNMFGQFPRIFGDLRQDENFCAMAACFSKTSFFQLTGLDEQVLFGKKIGDYHAFFRHVMDAYAEKEGKPHWLQKTHPVSLGQLYTAFPDAQFIITARNIKDTIRSSTLLSERVHGKRSGMLRQTALFHCGDRSIARYRSQPNVMCITYEKLREDRETLTKRMCEFLCLDFDACMLTDPFRKNTSFENKESRARTLSRMDEYCISLLDPVFRLLPMDHLVKAARVVSGRNQGGFVRDTFLTLRKQAGWKDDA